MAFNISSGLNKNFLNKFLTTNLDLNKEKVIQENENEPKKENVIQIEANNIKFTNLKGGHTKSKTSYIETNYRSPSSINFFYSPKYSTGNPIINTKKLSEARSKNLSLNKSNKIENTQVITRELKESKVKSIKIDLNAKNKENNFNINSYNSNTTQRKLISPKNNYKPASSTTNRSPELFSNTFISAKKEISLISPKNELNKASLKNLVKKDYYNSEKRKSYNTTTGDFMKNTKSNNKPLNGTSKPKVENKNLKTKTVHTPKVAFHRDNKSVSFIKPQKSSEKLLNKISDLPKKAEINLPRQKSPSKVEKNKQFIITNKNSQNHIELNEENLKVKSEILEIISDVTKVNSLDLPVNGKHRVKESRSSNFLKEPLENIFETNQKEENDEFIKNKYKILLQDYKL